MGVENDNLGADADMQGGVAQGDVAAEDPGHETRKRAVGISLFDYIHGYLSTNSFPPAPTLAAGHLTHMLHPI